LRSREIRSRRESREQSEMGTGRKAYEEHLAAVGTPFRGVVARCFNRVSHVFGGCGCPSFRGYPIAGVGDHVSPGSEHPTEAPGVGFRRILPAAATDKNYQWRRACGLLR